MVCQSVAYHRVALVCMAAVRGRRWYAVADRRGGRVVGPLVTAERLALCGYDLDLLEADSPFNAWMASA